MPDLLNRDEIIRMAREAGMREGESGDWTAADAALTYPECVYTENLERFAALVAAAEREACVEEIRYYLAHSLTAKDILDAIRARGQA